MGVARIYQPLAAGFVVDTADQDRVADIEALDMMCLCTNTIMSSPEVTADLCRQIIDLPLE